MKIFIILSLFCAQVYSECGLANTDPDIPKPFIANCDGTSPDKSDFLKTQNDNKPLDYVTRFDWTNFKGKLNADMLKFLPNLRGIEIKNSEFPKLPDNFFEPDAETLERIEMKDNKITTVEPNAFKDLKKLRMLRLHGNNIKGFQLESLKSCENLAHVGMPTETFMNMDVSKLKTWLPQLKMIILNDKEKDNVIVKDKIKEVQDQYKDLQINFDWWKPQL